MAIIVTELVKVIKLDLSLDKEEAEFLAGLVQNSLNGSESEKIAQFRKDLFEAIIGPTRLPRHEGTRG